MQLKIVKNEKKKGIELHFIDELPKGLPEHLLAIGFKQSHKEPLKWYASQHPAFDSFATSLKGALSNEGGFNTIELRPSFSPSQENIDHNKFSYITISYKKGGNKYQNNYVLFDSYKSIATLIATQYGKEHFGDEFIAVDVSPRNYKRKARKLLEQGKVITGKELKTKRGQNKTAISKIYLTPIFELAGEEAQGTIKVFQSWTKANLHVQRAKEDKREYLDYAIEWVDNQIINGRMDLELLSFDSISEYIKDYLSSIAKGKILSANSPEDIDKAKKLLSNYLFEDDKKLNKLSSKQKLTLLNEFDDFHEKRNEEFPEVEITEKELPLQFGSWLKSNYPELVSQKDSIWEEYNTLQDLSQPKAKKQQPYSAIYTKLNKVIPNLKERLDEGYTYGVSSFGEDSDKTDLSLNVIDKDDEGRYIIALSHYFEQDGDFIADPDIQIRINFNEETSESLTFRDRTKFIRVYPKKQGKTMVDFRQKKAQNKFLSTWLTSLINDKYKIVWGEPDSDEKNKADNDSDVTTTFQSGDIVKYYASPSNYDHYVILDPTIDEGQINAIRLHDIDSDDKHVMSGINLPVSELELIITQKQHKEIYGYDFDGINELALKVNDNSVLMPNSHYHNNGATYVKTSLFREGSDAQKGAKRILERAEKHLAEKSPYKIGKGWSSLDDKTIASLQELIDDNLDKLSIVREEYIQEDRENPMVSRATLISDKDKLFFQIYKDRTALISALNPFKDGIIYGGSTMPKTKLQKAIDYMVKYPERLVKAENQEQEESLTQQLLALGFEGLFSAEEALNKPYNIANLQSRWYDAYGHFSETYEEPATTKIKRFESEIDELKGKRDKKSKARRDLLKKQITDRANEVSQINNLLDDENIEFQQDLLNLIIERAKSQGFEFTDSALSSFLDDISEGLFNERLIASYYNSPIPEVVDQFIKDFFKEEERYSIDVDRKNDYVYKSFEEFVDDLIYQLEVQGKLSTHSAQAVQSVHVQSAEQKFKELESPTPVDAKQVAAELLELESSKETATPKAQEQIGSKVMDIVSRDQEVPNVLVPVGSKEPFISSSFYISDAAKIRELSPSLLKLNDDAITNATPVQLFELAQMDHPNQYGFNVSRSAVLREWEKRGKETFTTLGLPIDLNYPYVNAHVGYKSVYPLSSLLGDKYIQWWHAVSTYRPIADMEIAIRIINKELDKLKESLLELVSPKTKKPKAKDKQRYHDIKWDIESWEESKEVIQEYLKKNNSSGTTQTKTSKKEKVSNSKDLRDKYSLDEFIQFGSIGFDKLSSYKQSVVKKAKKVMEEAINLGYAIPFDYGRGKGKYATTEKANKLSFKEIFTHVYNNIHVDDLEPKSKPIEKSSKKNNKTYATTINPKGLVINNILIPKGIKEPFASGIIGKQELKQVVLDYPHLVESKVNIPSLKAIDLFRVTQLYFNLEVIERWRLKGEHFFNQLGYPTNYKYPYVSSYNGYIKVLPLGEILQIGRYAKDYLSWAIVIAQYRPIADVQEGMKLIDEYIKELEELKSSSKEKKNVSKELNEKLSQLSKSKKVIEEYLETLNREPSKKETSSQLEADKKYDYLDKVVAHLSEMYADEKRPTKGYIQKLQATLGVPNLGMMWEAAELSWLQWYKMLYFQSRPFESILNQMIYFWNKVQPTYAYSDSSKEIYKQYSTPCPISAIIAQYTRMKTAENIFEPSAGNGLLLVGADERKTHVNEIDQSRLASLRYQGFSKITSYNAAKPFPKEMTHKYDVVVTNPPFARWEDDKYDKEFIVRTYFHNQIGLAKHIRLEHMMAGLALHTMKDTGRAAIIIMGHIYFDKDGFIAKYRPFFNWLFRHYKVDDVINMNSFKLYNKQGAVEKTMLILIGGRKDTPEGVAPKKEQAPYLEDMVNSFSELWNRVKSHLDYTLDTVIEQLKIELKP